MLIGFGFISIERKAAFVDGDNNPITAGLYSDDRSYKTYFDDYIPGDVDDNGDPILEMGILIDLNTWGDDLPVIELAPSSNVLNQGDFSVSGVGWKDKTWYWESTTDTVGFTTDRIVKHTVTLTLKDPYIGPCNNGVDDDEDGYSDDLDPDCESGEDEIGYGTTACNDGIRQ